MSGWDWDWVWVWMEISVLQHLFGTVLIKSNFLKKITQIFSHFHSQILLNDFVFWQFYRDPGYVRVSGKFSKVQKRLDQWSHFNRVSTSPLQIFLEFVFLLHFWTQTIIQEFSCNVVRTCNVLSTCNIISICNFAWTVKNQEVPKSTENNWKEPKRTQKNLKRKEKKERYPKFKAGNALLTFLSQESFEGGLSREINTLLKLVEKYTSHISRERLNGG